MVITNFIYGFWNVCSILSGGNVDMNTLGNITNQGLFSRFREAEFILQVEDNSKRIEEHYKFISS